MATRGRIEIYEAADGWRWRFLAVNGESMCHGGEAFASKQSCQNSVKTVVGYFVDFNRNGLIVEPDCKVDQERVKAKEDRIAETSNAISPTRKRRRGKEDKRD